MLLLGYDIGTSSIKASLVDSDSGSLVGSASFPDTEMVIDSPAAGFAEQQPQMWWENVKQATAKLLAESGINAADITAVGITYQMHGLVCVDKNLQPLIPAIIWCDSRAVDIGSKAAEEIGREKCLENLLNLPGNFTASKLRWVKDNQPEIYRQTYKIMLPGDYIAMKMTGTIATTVCGLSEAVLWNFKTGSLADLVMDYFGFDREILPEIVPTFAQQGAVTKSAAEELGLKAGTPVTYRAGDQPNNAFSLNVLHPGQAAATAGTSGVVFAVSDNTKYDKLSRVNTFVHVSNTPETIRNGILLCVNGTGILNSWLRHNVAGEMDYNTMNKLAAEVPVGAEGLVVLPFGNGAERTLQNKNVSASIHQLDFNVHNTGHLLRAGQEGIVFAMKYGLDIISETAPAPAVIRAGQANMFLSDVFAQTFASVTSTAVELYNTDGSQGAARAAGIGAGVYADFEEAFENLKVVKTVYPDRNNEQQYIEAYQQWLRILNNQLAL